MWSQRECVCDYFIKVYKSVMSRGNYTAVICECVYVFGVVVKAKAQKGPEVGWFNIEFYSNVV